MNWKAAAVDMVAQMERQAAGVYAKGGALWPQYWIGERRAARCTFREGPACVRSQWWIDGKPCTRAEAVNLIAARMERSLG